MNKIYQWMIQQTMLDCQTVAFTMHLKISRKSWNCSWQDFSLVTSVTSRGPERLGQRCPTHPEILCFCLEFPFLRGWIMLKICCWFYHHRWWLEHLVVWKLWFTHWTWCLYIYWLVLWNHGILWLSHHIGNVISSQLTIRHSFQGGRLKPPTSHVLITTSPCFLNYHRVSGMVGSQDQTQGLDIGLGGGRNPGG